MKKERTEKVYKYRLENKKLVKVVLVSDNDFDKLPAETKGKIVVYDSEANKYLILLKDYLNNKLDLETYANYDDSYSEYIDAVEICNEEVVNFENEQHLVRDFVSISHYKHDYAARNLKTVTDKYYSWESGLKKFIYSKYDTKTECKKEYKAFLRKYGAKNLINEEPLSFERVCLLVYGVDL